jgi:hypothetical protein
VRVLGALIRRRQLSATECKNSVNDDPRQQEFARHIVRYAEQRPVWDAGFACLAYIGEGGAPPDQYRMDMICLPKGVAVRGYNRCALIANGAAWSRRLICW